VKGASGGGGLWSKGTGYGAQVGGAGCQGCQWDLERRHGCGQVDV
jgi:hypothetical protein